MKKRLSDLEFEVTQNCATEPPFNNKYYNEFNDGIYVDITNGEPLFSSKDKFQCTCGWPSFSKPIENAYVSLSIDNSLNMNRIEVKSTVSHSHLGHLFTDGPREFGGLRFCINSASLIFVPKEDMNNDRYKAYLEFL
ncbi:MAG: peptide-methionine (R)-S-oxide reductase MsrB [Marinifilaceae bacterium]|nr:peptide-methionine (R)-S-oxide reductase MsrB [Marinifilaceae bacterium]